MLWDTDSRIGDGNRYELFWYYICARPWAKSSGDRQLSPFWHRIQGVHDHVDKGVLDFRGIRLDDRQTLAEIQLEANPAAKQWSNQFQRCIDDVIDSDWGCLRFPWTA